MLPERQTPEKKKRQKLIQCCFQSLIAVSKLKVTQVSISTLLFITSSLLSSGFDELDHHRKLFIGILNSTLKL